MLFIASRKVKAHHSDTVSLRVANRTRSLSNGFSCAATRQSAFSRQRLKGSDSAISPDRDMTKRHSVEEAEAAMPAWNGSRQKRPLY